MKNNSNFQFILTVVITLIIHLFLLFQNMFAASFFGISSQMDAYNIAFNITTFIFSFFAVSVTTVLIPSLNNKNSTNASNTFITIFAVIVLILVCAIFLFSHSITNIVFDNPLIPNIVFILTVGFLFKAFTGILIAIFQVNNSFVIPKLIQAISAVIVVILLLFTNGQSIMYYSIAISLGFIVEFFVNLYLLKKQNINYRYKITFDLKNQEFRSMMVNFFPVFFSTALYQIMLLINITIAENLGEGNVSILTYSNQLYGMVNALLIVNLLAFMFPKLVKLISSNNSVSIAKLEDYIIVALTLMTFIVIEFYLHGRDAIAILFQRGLFDASVTDIVFDLSFLYFLLLPFGAVRDLFYRYFYADNDTFTPFRNSIVVSIINIVLSIILSNFFGLFGIVLGTVIAGIFSLIMIILKFKKKYNAIFNLKVITIECIKVIVIGCLIILIGKFIFGYFMDYNIIIRNLFLIPFSSILFFGLLFLFKGRLFSIRI